MTELTQQDKDQLEQQAHRLAEISGELRAHESFIGLYHKTDDELNSTRKVLTERADELFKLCLSLSALAFRK